jgi:CBS domain-containing protein/gas vesicle protein
MKKAYEVMTHTLATTSPNASVSTVASIMRDRNIGDVLIMEDGKLRGIVTDRDLAIQALTGTKDPLNAPISDFMNSHVVTGEYDWSLERVAAEMAKHQIRRLPIFQKDQLVGIISLGDVAMYEKKDAVVSRSLEAISNPIPVTGRASKMGGALLPFMLGTVVTALVLYLTMNQNGKQLRKQLEKSNVYKSAHETVKDTVNAALDKVDEAASSKQVRQLTKQVRSNVKDLTAQMPMLDGRAMKRKHFLFG